MTITISPQKAKLVVAGLKSIHQQFLNQKNHAQSCNWNDTQLTEIYNIRLTEIKELIEDFENLENTHNPKIEIS
jgi:hypothetical protein